MMAQRPTAKTASSCYLEEESCTHTFEISRHSMIQAILAAGPDAKDDIASKSFSVGGHDFRIRYYPNGKEGGSNDHVAVYLELTSRVTVPVRLLFDFRLLVDDDDDGESIYKPPTVTVLTAESLLLAVGPPTFGTDEFMEKTKLEQEYLRDDDRLVIECDVTVIKESQLRDTAVPSYSFGVKVPDSSLSQDLYKWFSEGKGVDVTIKAAGNYDTSSSSSHNNTFCAHRLLLAMRSPFFYEKLYAAAAAPAPQGGGGGGGGAAAARDRRTTPADNNHNHNHNNSSVVITVDDLKADVLGALLHFIYTDELRTEDQNQRMATELFGASGTYQMDRMRLYCGSILSKGLTVQSVTGIIGLAHTHGCKELKDACIQFIMSSEERYQAVTSSAEFKTLEPKVALEIVQSHPRMHNKATAGTETPAAPATATGRRVNREGPSHGPARARGDANHGPRRRG